MTSANPPDRGGTEGTLPAHQPIRSYVLRQGRMTAAQAQALRTLAPQFLLDGNGAALDFPSLFGRHAPVLLEIGCGMGETTVQIAQAYPDQDFLGVEVHAPGVGSLMHRAHAAAVTNLRVIQHDAREVLLHRIPLASLAGIHVFFPDPWPKKRHHKRRLIQPEFAALLASRLQIGGYLHCATDWEDYAQQMLAVLSAEPLLVNRSEGFAPRPAHRPLTKFERRGLALGHGVWDLIFDRSAEMLTE